MPESRPADLGVPMSEGGAAGPVVAFLGGIVRYIVENKKYFEEYVVAYTNAPVSSRHQSW